MQEITSVQNPIIKETAALHQKKHRVETGLFLIEGAKGVEEALNPSKSGLEIKYVFLSKEKYESASPEAVDLSKVYFVDEKVMKKISTTESPPEIVAVAFQKIFSLNDLFVSPTPNPLPQGRGRDIDEGLCPLPPSYSEFTLILVLENIKDAGNLGTIIRTAKAANVSGIILTGECIDIYNPKVVRATAANLWKLPVIYFKETLELRKEIEKFKTCRFFATKVADEENQKPQKSYHEVNYNQPAVILFGSESEGISDELASQADEFIKIPMNKEVESLNLSVSAGIIMYEAFKQRS